MSRSFVCPDCGTRFSSGSLLSLHRLKPCVASIPAVSSTLQEPDQLFSLKQRFNLGQVETKENASQIVNELNKKKADKKFQNAQEEELLQYALKDVRKIKAKMLKEEMNKELFEIQKRK